MNTKQTNKRIMEFIWACSLSWSVVDISVWKIQGFHSKGRNEKKRRHSLASGWGWPAGSLTMMGVRIGRRNCWSQSQVFRITLLSHLICCVPTHLKGMPLHNFVLQSSSGTTDFTNPLTLSKRYSPWITPTSLVLLLYSTHTLKLTLYWKILQFSKILMSNIFTIETLTNTFH